MGADNAVSENLRTKRRERFVALAEKRVTRAIKDLRLIGNLSNRNNYRYTEKDAEIILRALQKELNKLRERFSADQSTDGISFKIR